MARALVAAGIVCAALGCKKPRVLRLTYDVDVATAYDGTNDAEQVMRRTREVVEKRLGSRTATVSTHGNELVVDLAAMPPDDLEATKAVIGRPGRLAFQMLDDPGTKSVLGPPLHKTEADGDGIGVHDEMAPDGVDASGKMNVAKSYFARIECRPTEIASACKKRLEAWTATLALAADRRIVFEPSHTGWRTYYVAARAELTQSDIARVRVADKDCESGASCALYLTFSPAAAQRFEDLTGANVNRRMAIVIDDVVSSAPVIRSKIAGGAATITMGGGLDRKDDLAKAKELERVLGSGALPAPLSLSAESQLGAR
jgi:preprotein translocase subunit SecD